MIRVSTEDATELLHLCGNLDHGHEGKRKRVKRSFKKWLHSLFIVEGKVKFLTNWKHRYLSICLIKTKDNALYVQFYAYIVGTPTSIFYCSNKNIQLVEGFLNNETSFLIKGFMHYTILQNIKNT